MPPAPGVTLARLIDGMSGRGERPLLQVWGAREPVDWSYADGAEQVLGLARGLRRRLQPGEVVALLGAEGFGWIACALAVIRAGGVVAPVDVQHDDDTLAHILQDSGARWVFTDARRAPAAREAADRARLVRLDEEGEEAPVWESLCEAGDEHLPEPSEDDTAVLFYTSGTTGPPKGVPLSHANLDYQLRVLADAGIAVGDDRVLLPLPLHHVYPFVVGMLTPIHLGLTLVMPRALTGQHLVRAARDGEASLIIGVPGLYGALLDGMRSQAQRSGRLAGLALSGALGTSRFIRRRLGLRLGRRLLAPARGRLGPRLRVLASGGAPLDPATAWTLESVGWQVAEGYGLTETSPLLTINPPGRGRIGSVGRAVPGTELRIRPGEADGETGGESEGESGGHGAGDAADSEGEIQARGPGVFSRYHNRDDASREAFTDDGWFRTGDLGWLDGDGYLHVTGRLSTLIVTEGGENVQPDALEARYARHPAIREIGILQHEGRLVGLAVPEQSGDGAERVERAAAEVGRGLPSYQRLARCLPTTRPLPRTRLGKIQRHRLAERYDAERAGAGEQVSSAPMDVADMSAPDRALLEEPAARAAWDWLARSFPDAGLTPESDLRQDLGVDSMQWLGLTMDLLEQTGVDLSEDAVARVERVRDLLEEVVNAAGSDEGAASPLEDPERALDERQQRWLQPRGPALGAAARLLHGGNRLVMRALFPVSVRGLEHLPERGPFVLACNHESYLDPFAIAAALPYRHLERLYWGGWTGAAFGNPVKRLVSRTAQAVPIDPDRGPRSSLAFAAAVLEAGNGLVWFPEGERSPTGELQAFKPGLGLILEHHPVPVVPAVLRGGHRALPRGRRLPRPGKLELELGEPLDPAELARRGRGDGEAERVTDALHAEVERLWRSGAADQVRPPGHD